MLLDEPLSNLDQRLREQLRFELKRLQREAGVTTLYVTHDQHEALALSDRVGIMMDGRLLQVGDPETIYFRPASPAVAQFLGCPNFLEGTLLDAAPAGHTARLQTALGIWRGVLASSGQRGDRCVVAVRPEAILLLPEGLEGEVNTIEAKVLVHNFLGHVHRYQIQLANGPIWQWETRERLPAAGMVGGYVPRKRSGSCEIPHRVRSLQRVGKVLRGF